MPYATANGIQIYYEEEGAGEPLLLVAGYSVDSSQWLTVRKELSRHFRLVLPDNRGSGRTDCPEGPISIEQMAGDVMGLCEVLQLKKPHILGHSMGGMIAQLIAHRYPEQIGKIVLSQTVFKLHEVSKAAIRSMHHLADQQIPMRNIIEVSLPWLFSDDFLGHEWKVELYIENRLAYPYPITLEALKKQFAALCQFDSSSWYQKIAVPVLVLCGDEDRLCPPNDSRLFAKGIRGAVLHVFPKMGHLASIELPEEHNRVVCDFLLK